MAKRSVDVYGRDRLFVYLRHSAPDSGQDTCIGDLQRAGQAVVRITVDEPYDLGEEFFRWKFATAVAGSILGIHPFDQPDVEASKIAPRKLTEELRKKAQGCPMRRPYSRTNGSRSLLTIRMRLR